MATPSTCRRAQLGVEFKDCCIHTQPFPSSAIDGRINRRNREIGSRVEGRAVSCPRGFFTARCNRQSFRCLDGMTMNTGLHCIEVTGLGGLAKLTGIGGASSGRPEQGGAGTSRSGFVWLTATLMIGFGAWTDLSEDARNTAEPLH